MFCAGVKSWLETLGGEVVEAEEKEEEKKEKKETVREEEVNVKVVKKVVLVLEEEEVEKEEEVWKLKPVERRLITRGCSSPCHPRESPDWTS